MEQNCNAVTQIRCGLECKFLNDFGLCSLSDVEIDCEDGCQMFEQF